MGVARKQRTPNFPKNKHFLTLIRIRTWDSSFCVITDDIFVISLVNNYLFQVKRSVFFIYAKSIGLISTVLVLVLAFAAEGFLIGTRFWLAKWSSDFNITEAKRDHYLIVYGGLGIGQGLSIWVENLIFSYAVVKGAKNLHVLILKNVLRCPMSFFETTPIGRIVNRFSKDVNMIDEGVPKNLKSFISCFMTLIGTVLVISLSTPLFLTMLIPIAILYYLTQVRSNAHQSNWKTFE